MKIVYCIPSLHIPGGRERVITNKVNWLASRGYDLTIITTDQGIKPSFYPIDSRVKIKDLHINYQDQSKRPIWLKIPYFFLNRYLHYSRLRSTLNQIQADIIISTFANEMAYLHKYATRSKKILELHTSTLYINHLLGNKLLDRWRKKDILTQIRKFDSFVVLTQTDRANCEGGGFHTNTIAIPNALTYKSEFRSSLNNQLALCVGRLNHIKGIERLIDIWAVFHRTHPDWILEIVGDGELKEKLQQQIINKGLQKCIQLSAATVHIQQKYQDSSILLLTSYMESFGMVLIEAQACGVPVIAYDVPCGPAEIIHDGEDGFLIKDGDIDDFVKKLSLVATNENLRHKMGNAAYLNAQRYSEDAIMAQWEDLFHKLSHK